MSLRYSRSVIPTIIFMLLGMSVATQAQKYPDWFLYRPTESLQSLTFTPLLEESIVALTDNPTGEKPQSKVWQHAGKWWAVWGTNTDSVVTAGTYVWRLDGDNWTPVLLLSTVAETRSDCKRVGDVTHILMHGNSPALASIEYVPATMTYQMWSVRPANVSISLPGSETAVIDVDSSGRMFLATEDGSDMVFYYSDSPYSVWTGPIVLWELPNDDDIGLVTVLNDSVVAFFGSDQDGDQYLFRPHKVGTLPDNLADPLAWGPLEVAASGGNVADDHINAAVCADGTLYVAAKTTDTDDMILLIRRPAPFGTPGSWDPVHTVIDGKGTRPIVLLNDVTQTVSVLYQESTGSGGDIIYRESPMSSIAFGPETALISGQFTNTSSTKENYTNEIVIIASTRDTEGQVVGVLGKAPVTTQTFTKTYAAGWNLVGLPNNPADPHYQVLFPSSDVNTLYRYNSGYVLDDTLESSLGYWLNFSAAGQVDITGDSVAQVTINLVPGWNLIAGPSCDVALIDIDDPNLLMDQSTFFGYSTTYTLSDSMKQGNAYWIFSNGTGTVTASCAAGPGMLARTAGSLSTLPERFPALTISDRSGAAQTLYFDAALAADDPFSYRLPPLAPVDGFDARFEDDRYLSEAAEARIRIRTRQYPVTVRAGNLSRDPAARYVVQTMRGNAVVGEHLLNEGQDLVIHNPAVNRLKVQKIGDAATAPARFMLAQNYPNPFNPATTIRYDLSARSRVSLTVFDALGRQVTTLVSGVQPDGTYEATWNGRDHTGQKVSSGVYFYRLTATPVGSGAPAFLQVRKMLLVQ